jgi:hypothetical protein
LGWLKCWPSCHSGGSDNIVASAMLEACVLMGCWFQNMGQCSYRSICVIFWWTSVDFRGALGGLTVLRFLPLDRGLSCLSFGVGRGAEINWWPAVAGGGLVEAGLYPWFNQRSC